MGAIPLEHGLAVAGILFCLGLVGLMVRRNILFVLMSTEVMMNASATGVRRRRCPLGPARRP